MQISRMDLADFGSPETIVQGILDQVPDMPVPIPIEVIATSLEITDIKEIGAGNFEGGLLTDREKSEGTILVNRRSHHKRQRFTIGHELGHFLMPLHLPERGTEFMCTSADMKKADLYKTMDHAARMEVEANRFAANILMPAPLFQRDLNRSAAPDLDMLVRLADRYDTSKEATARRFCELHDTPTAAVFSKDGRFIYAVKGRAFPFIPLQKGNAIPQGSLTARFTGTEGTTSDMDGVDASLWVDAKPYARHQLLEQALIQIDGFRLTLLQVDEEEIEAAEEEGDLVESYTPRFRRR